MCIGGVFLGLCCIVEYGRRKGIFRGGKINLGGNYFCVKRKSEK